MKQTTRRSEFFTPLLVTLLLALELIAGTASAPSGYYPGLKQDYNTTVYITPHGKCYHRTDKCMTLKHSKHISSTTRDKAEAKGRKACKVCFEL